MKHLKLYAFFLVLFFMTSCATRKVAISTVKSEADVENLETEKKDLAATESSTVTITSEVTQADDTTIERKIFTPIDPTKPSSFTDDKGNKKELNNASYTEEKTASKTAKKEATTAESAQAKTIKDKGAKSNSARTKTKEATKGKNTGRTSFNWWLLLILIPIGIYFFRRRNNWGI